MSFFSNFKNCFANTEMLRKGFFEVCTSHTCNFQISCRLKSTLVKLFNIISFLILLPFICAACICMKHMQQNVPLYVCPATCVSQQVLRLLQQPGLAFPERAIVQAYRSVQRIQIEMKGRLVQTCHWCVAPCTR